MGAFDYLGNSYGIHSTYTDPSDYAANAYGVSSVGGYNPFAEKHWYNPFGAQRYPYGSTLNNSPSRIRSNAGTVRGPEYYAAKAAEKRARIMNQQTQNLVEQQNKMMAQAKADARAEAQRMAKVRESVFEAMSKKFSDYGLDGKEILNVLKKLPGGVENNPDVLIMKIRETDTWNKRFGAVMDARRKAGLPALDEAEVFGLEQSFRQALNSHDLPKGFYDHFSDFHKWIANDVSPAEIEARASLAEQTVNNKDPKFIKSFRDYYGAGKKDLVAYMLDRKRGLVNLEQKIAAAELGAEARQQKMEHFGKNFAEKLVDKGITRDEARVAMNETEMTESELKALAKIDGVKKVGERRLLKANLGMDVKAQKKINRLKSRERARFNGSSGGENVFGDGGETGGY